MAGGHEHAIANPKDALALGMVYQHFTLLVSEDLDELLELSDRLVVMFHGQ